MAINYDEYRRVMETLAEANFRDLSATCTLQRHETANWLLRRGYVAEDIEALWSYSQRAGTKSPEGFFASSFGRPSGFDKRVDAARKWRTSQAHKKDDACRDSAAPVFSIKRGRKNG